MRSPRLRALFELAGASCLALCIVVVFIYFRPRMPDFTVGNFFSYFTIQSNIFTVIFLLASAFGLLSSISRDQLRAMLLLFMGITTSVYWLALHRFFVIDDAGARTANIALHWLAFAVLLIDTYWSRPTAVLEARLSWLWVLYPFLYGVYSLIRGALTGWYPYPFLDAGKLGYPLIAGISVFMIVSFFASARALRFVHNRWFLKAPAS